MNAAEVVGQTVEAVARAIVIRQSEFSLRVEDDGFVLNVTMRANVGDAKRLVGAQAAHLVALREIARLVCWGSHFNRRVEFGRVQSGDGPEVAMRKLRPVTEERFAVVASGFSALVKRIAALVFPGCSVEVWFLAGQDDESSLMRVNISGIQRTGADERVEAFGRSLETLFPTIGRKEGRIIHVDVNRTDRGHDAEDHAARGTVRRFNVYCSEPFSGVAAIHCVDSGELGERDVQLRRLGNSAQSEATEDWQPGRTV